LGTSSFLRGAAILTIAGLISKLLGALYRIPFFRVVGSEGMGLYQMAYPLYTMLLAVSSAGIPVAISKLVSENLARRDYYGVTKVFRVSLLFIALFSGTTSILLYKSAYYLAGHVLLDSRAGYSIMAIAPAVFLVSVMSVFRGYFQGYQEMAPTACSQVLEQAVRVLTVLVGAYFLLPRGIEFAAAAATFGTVTGAAAGIIFLAGLYFQKPRFDIVRPSKTGFIGKGSNRGVFGILNRVIVLALPISLAGLVMPVMQAVDALTVPGRLHLAGYSVSRAAQLYGQLSGGAVTLVNLPTIITISLASSLVPAISSLFERGNYREVNKQIGTALEITIMVCLPAAVGLAVLGAPVSDLLFKCPEAGVSLAFLAPAAVLLGLHQTTSGVLQGMGRTFLPAINLALGAVIKFFINYTLTAVPRVGIIGAALGTVGGFLISSTLNFIFVLHYTGWRPDLRTMLLKPTTAATIMGVGVYFSYFYLKTVLGSSWATVISILAGVICYVLVLAVLGSFQKIGIIGPGIIFRSLSRKR